MLGIKRPFSKLSRSEDGVAALEFALMTPLLLVIFVGAVAAFDSARALRDSAYAAGTVSDLVTRFIDFDDSRRDNMFVIADSILKTFDDGSTYELSITSVRANPNPNAGNDPNNVGPDDEPVLGVQWSEATDANDILEDTDLQNLSLPQLALGETIIVVRLTGTYIPIISGLNLPTEINFERQAVRRPRFVSEIAYITD